MTSSTFLPMVSLRQAPVPSIPAGLLLPLVIQISHLMMSPIPFHPSVPQVCSQFFLMNWCRRSQIQVRYAPYFETEYMFWCLPRDADTSFVSKKRTHTKSESPPISKKRTRTDDMHCRGQWRARKHNESHQHTQQPTLITPNYHSVYLQQWAGSRWRRLRSLLLQKYSIVCKLEKPRGWWTCMIQGYWGSRWIQIV